MALPSRQRIPAYPPTGATGTVPAVPADHARNAPVAREGLCDLPATPAPVTDYAVFGGVMRTALEFPSLRVQAGAHPTWTVHRSGSRALPVDARSLGTDGVDASVSARLYRSRAAWHLVYDDTGCFDIDTAGDEIVWRAPESVSEEAARLDLIGRVLAMAMHAAGDVCFHASAVAVDGEAIAFLGAKGFGKSTLAWALVRAGARLLTDDTLRVQLDATPLAYPGVHELRLRSDAATRLPPAPREARLAGGRMVVDTLALTQLQADPVPFGALYLLSPVNELPGGAAARVSALPAVPAALSLVRHAKIAPLLAGADAVALLDRVVDLVRRIPVRLLEVSRDFDRLDDVVTDVLSQHADRMHVSAS